MNDYFCYGLHVRSEILMPELKGARDENADVIVRYGNVNPPKDRTGDRNSQSFNRESGAIRLWMDRVGGLEVRHGREIIISPVDGAEEKGFRFLISGIGMGLILHQRNVSSLHASATVIDGGAVAFVGGKGMGKSTTAATFHQENHPVVTDDLLPYQARGERIEVLPAFPNLKLFSDSVETVLGEDSSKCPRVDPRGDKRTRSVEEGFSEEILPLQCVYVLDWGGPKEALSSSRINGREACVELLRNSFALRILEADGATSEELGQVSRLVENVPVKRLTRPRSLDRATKIPSFIRHDLRASNLTVKV